jgi:hypothetical protein
VLLTALLLPALFVLALDSDVNSSALAEHPWACYQLYWFVALWAAALSTIIALHLLVWLAPRPASQVDSSPLSAMLAAILLAGPPLFAAWAFTILVWPGHTAQLCSAKEHRGLWAYFTAVTSAGAIALASIGAFMARFVWQALMRSPTVLPAASQPVGASELALDNGRWLINESRKIRGQVAVGGAPRAR